MLRRSFIKIREAVKNAMCAKRTCLSVCRPWRTWQSGWLHPFAYLTIQSLVVGWLIAVITTRTAHAHGTPINVTVSAGALVATGSVADSEGFAPQIAVQTEGGAPLGSFSLPNVGPVILWQMPAFSISGLNEETLNVTSLSIEVLERPVKDSSPVIERTVWYWKPAEPHVSASAADIHLLGTNARFTTLPANGDPPAPFQLASSLTGQQQPDNHGLLSYGLDNDTVRPAGAYGFFARLTSNMYAPSNPFLMVFNYQLDDEQMVDAALAINAAAADPTSLPGDFNHDDAVNAADYVVWRKGLPTDGNDTTWQTNFGRTQNGSGGAAPVPEPVALISLSSALAIFAIRRRPREH
jgi:hypothetical protein